MAKGISVKRIQLEIRNFGIDNCAVTLITIRLSSIYRTMARPLPIPSLAIVIQNFTFTCVDRLGQLTLIAYYAVLFVPHTADYRASRGRASRISYC